mgnify:CR=1 FL=1
MKCYFTSFNYIVYINNCIVTSEKTISCWTNYICIFIYNKIIIFNNLLIINPIISKKCYSKCYWFNLLTL